MTTTPTTTHATFTLDRHYDAGVDRVFTAWSDEQAKSAWFAHPGADYRLDFRVGGTEHNAVRFEGAVMSFDTLYRDIVPGERIVYTSILARDGQAMTASLTTVEFSPEGQGTHLRLTEQGAYLDGHELPEWREKGTSDQLDKLAGTF